MTFVSRRRWLRGAAALVPLAPLALRAPPVLARSEGVAREPCLLRFEHLHTGEKLVLEHRAGQPLETQAQSALDRLLRDFRTDEVGAMDSGLLDQLASLVQATGSARAFEIISGYRSGRTNETLRERSTGVARASLHLQGRAIDVRLADVPLAALRDAAVALGRGGVGFYPGSNFVHLDTGRVRRW